MRSLRKLMRWLRGGGVHEFDFGGRSPHHALRSLYPVIVIWDTSDDTVAVDWGSLTVGEAVEILESGLDYLHGGRA